MMRSLLDHLDEIEMRWRQASSLLLVLDCDGLIGDQGGENLAAGLPPALAGALEELTARDDILVALMSGRDRGELQARVSVPGLIYIGNNGLQISGPGLMFIEPAAVGCSDALEALAADLSARLRAIDGAVVEDNGMTLRVLYQQVRDADLDELRRLVHATLADKDHPFHLTSGDRYYEVRPRVAWTKADAIGWIKDQRQHPEALVCYVGHDAADEETFAALGDAITVKVGGAADSAARYRADERPHLETFLNWLIDRNRTRQRSAIRRATLARQNS